MHVSQTEITTLKTVGQLFVIDPQFATSEYDAMLSKMVTK